VPDSGHEHALTRAPYRLDTVWSEWVQSVRWIDPVRERRFGDQHRDLLWPLLGLRRGGTTVEVGCGGGALTRSLARWMGPGCAVYGIDRDRNFLCYARRRAREQSLHHRTRYLEGDALALPLLDAIADAVTSYTVIEHIADTEAFLREQIRVCKPGGRLSVMQVQGEGGFSSSPKRSARPSERERELWRPLERAFRRQVERPLGVASARVGLAELPALLEALGLAEIMLEPFADVDTLDDARVDLGRARQHLKDQENWTLAMANRIASLLIRPLPEDHLASLKRCVKARFRKQRRWLEAGIRTWDFSVSVSWVVSGRVR